MPFKPKQDRRHHVPRRRRGVTNWPAYDASPRRRGDLTVWSSDEAIEAWAAEPRTTRGGQPQYPSLAILTALTSRAVSRLAHRQAEGPTGSIVGLLGPALRVPDRTTPSRRAATPEVPRPRPGSDAVGGDGSVHPPVDGTGLRLCGAGEWPIEKHGTRTRRSWKKLHSGVDADTGRSVASAPTGRDVDDGAQVGPLLDQAVGSLASFTGDGAHDQESVYAGVAEQHGRMGWQKASGYTKRARAEAAVARWKRMIAAGPRSRKDERRATASTACWNSDARTTSAPPDPGRGWGQCVHTPLIHAPRHRVFQEA